MKHRCYLSLGSNMGNREDYLNGALEKLQDNSLMDVTKISSYYETDPVGKEDQSRFLNAAVEVETYMSPQEVLEFIQDMEMEFNRVRDERWGPRTLDIDILMYENVEVNEMNLTIPHPLLEDRAFVLIPLGDIAPDLKLPSGREVAAAVEGIVEKERKGVMVYKKVMEVDEG